MERKISDPLENYVAQALDDAGIVFKHESEGDTLNLDFHLPDHGLYVEVKRFHSDRIAGQMSRAGDVIALQGSAAVDLFCKLLRSEKTEPLSVNARQIRRKRLSGRSRGVVRVLRDELWEIQGGRCWYCHRETQLPGPGQIKPFPSNVLIATVDHKIPLCRGGDPIARSNLVIACDRCNQAKGEKTAAEFGDQRPMPTLVAQGRYTEQELRAGRKPALEPLLLEAA